MYNWIALSDILDFVDFQLLIHSSSVKADVHKIRLLNFFMSNSGSRVMVTEKGHKNRIHGVHFGHMQPLCYMLAFFSSPHM
jgi:hypothetical protein